MSPNCECGHERGDHGPKMWGCAYCPCTAYEARPPESTDSFNSGSYTDSFTPEVETRPIITRVDFFGTEYVPKAAWVEAQSSLDALRLQLDEARKERDKARQETEFWSTRSEKRHDERDEARAQLVMAEQQLDEARQARDRYKAERDEARDKRFFWENACRRAEGVMVQEAQAKHEALWQLMEATGPVSRETVEKATRAAAVAWVSATNANDVMAYANTSLFSQIVRAAIAALGRTVEGA